MQFSPRHVEVSHVEHGAVGDPAIGIERGALRPVAEGHTSLMTATTDTAASTRLRVPRTILEVALGVALGRTGIAHLSTQRETFQAQVPGWFPVEADLVVVVSGVVEIVLAAALLAVLLPAFSRWRVAVGLTVAAFFVVIFPGNVAQFTERRDAFGLDSDTARGVRLLFQPLLVAAALWSTGAWPSLAAFVRARRSR